MKTLPKSSIALTALLVTAGTSYAQSGTMLDVDTIKCGEVMRLSGTDRDVTVAFLHGYLAGKGGKSTVDENALAEITDKFLDACIAQPEATAVSLLK